MDFFAAQDKARARTWWLALLFAAAVLLIMAAVHLAAALILGMADAPDILFEPGAMLVTMGSTLAIILCGTLYRTMAVSAGGPSVASALGASPVSPESRDPGERRLLNVVEEMAIAAGIPVPRAYVIHGERGINAFAAGLGLPDAVVAVTDGALARLSRDELQAVVGHEFSHILNGDMRLNMRLMGLLFGILLLALAGQALVRMAASRRQGGRDGGRRGGETLAIVLGGLALIAIGHIGVFFGNLIKSAVSRQREFLADAASAQLTRNPAALASALRKIMLEGSSVSSAAAAEASHFFFSNAVSAPLLPWFATHPPLEERIRRLDPAALAGVEPGGGFASRHATPAAGAPAAGSGECGLSGASGGRPAGEPLASSGDPEAADPAGIMPEESPLRLVPPSLREAARNPDTAAALLRAMLLARMSGPAAAAAASAIRGDDGRAEAAMRLRPEAAALPREAALPLAELAVAGLARMRPESYRSFREEVSALVAADGEMDLFEFALAKVVLHRLDACFGMARTRGLRGLLAPEDLAPEASAVISLLARAGARGRRADEAEASFRAARAAAPAFGGRLLLLPPEACGLAAFDAALERAARGSSAAKRALLAACMACVTRDGRVTGEEYELYRSVAARLDCPAPPRPRRAA